LLCNDSIICILKNRLKINYLNIKFVLSFRRKCMLIDNILPSSKVPQGSLSDKWDNYINSIKPINPANKKKYHIIVVGTGLAGASASASLADLGFRVSSFCYQDSPRRAHSIAAQGGINAAKNYQNDGDSCFRLFHDTVKGGDFRSREANVYRLAVISRQIIDQCVAQGVPLARDYAGLLDNRSFGGSLVSRTFYARGQTGQQLLLGAYGALNKQIKLGNIKSHTRTEMQSLVLINGHAKGIITRNLVTGEINRHASDVVVLATGGYSTVFYLSTNAVNCNVSAAFNAYKHGALFANPCYTQIHPTCIPVHGDFQSKLTLMSESLRNDGRVWVPKKQNEERVVAEIPEKERDYYLERKYPSFGNLSPRDITSRSAKEVCDEGRGVGTSKLGVYLDFQDAIDRYGKKTIEERYGNLFHMYYKITNENPYEKPMRIFPAPHYTMGGLWVNYELMSNIPGLFVLGEANFSDHGANRLGASALMQGLADGYFVLPYTLSPYLNSIQPGSSSTDMKEFDDAEGIVKDNISKILNIGGKTPAESFHRELGLLMWNNCGMARTEKSLKEALEKIPQMREDFWKSAKVLGKANEFNPYLERACRIADYLEFAEVMCFDALERSESCGGHFREESQTDDNEAKRNDKDFCHVSAWKYMGRNNKPSLFKEKLTFENITLSQRSYK
jgi:succinate dehydrogenase / fumarate reductase flavoprotein subunit